MLVTVIAFMMMPGCCTAERCGSNPHGSSYDAASTDPDPELARLITNLTGWFDSSAQAAEDSEHYFPIRLVMVPIWEGRTFSTEATGGDAVTGAAASDASTLERWNQGAWLYVEQAVIQAADRPYRQRVYHVHRASDTGELRSDVYTLPGASPLAFAGAWATPDASFADLTPADLDLRDGCSILLQADMVLTPDGPRPGFVGATTGRGCASTLGGASYATSEVVLTDDRLVSWDRGFNDAGEQVWGATEGGYIFIRQGDRPESPDHSGPAS